ncbi:MAG: hypothetical protein SFY69_11400 [Planctomycetota bacterium]|nr:hypothetical protein [Planctomycetota bacterium]
MTPVSRVTMDGGRAAIEVRPSSTVWDVLGDSCNMWARSNKGQKVRVRGISSDQTSAYLTFDEELGQSTVLWYTPKRERVKCSVTIRLDRVDVPRDE